METLFQQPIGQVQADLLYPMVVNHGSMLFPPLGLEQHCLHDHVHKQVFHLQHRTALIHPLLMDYLVRYLWQISQLRYLQNSTPNHYQWAYALLILSQLQFQLLNQDGPRASLHKHLLYFYPDLEANGHHLLLLNGSLHQDYQPFAYTPRRQVCQRQNQEYQIHRSY
ncbi:Uncharacterised protein [Mycobacterium tuberculosis]|nr:Uncharacterised protein [Mycobacterium tuberculosis]